METLSPTRYLGQKIIRAFGLVRAGEEPRPGECIACSFSNHTLAVRIPEGRTTVCLDFIVDTDGRLVGWAHLRTGEAIHSWGPLGAFSATAREPLAKINNLMDGYLPYALYGPCQSIRRDQLIGWLTEPARSSDSPMPVTSPIR